MTIGVIFAAYNTADYLPRSLAPWIEARKAGLGGHSFKICAVSCPFEGFDAGPEDGTLEMLRGHLAAGDIDHMITSEVPLKETTARGRALEWLVNAGVDILWQFDSDEVPTTDQIARIAAFVTARPHVCWFKTSYKNRVFTPDQYLVKSFQPARIHRVRVGSLRADWFWDDNNVYYTDENDPTHSVRDKNLPLAVVPPSVAWTDHLTWISDSRAQKKQAYQWARWGNCDFSWDDSRGGLVWRDGLNPPETARD